MPTEIHPENKNTLAQVDSLTRKSDRIHKPVEKLSYERRNQCVICKMKLKDIGIYFNDAVCSYECLKKQMKHDTH